ncbi:hypothetical protein C9374_011411 [Naegleria lovaniensis]|uniref:Copper homeostasis protein cutC homolog n=1 Tax=Naegleria lovaniensis TaxID=51637 RepID=A0AA88H2B7_NAELO|nr:uncharacterized protein C9374_011411 [Naegleria lovaniensis]KAG2392686.1 hypothetical protein C9374_011411 [Naegleria lovaniensis]
MKEGAESNNKNLLLEMCIDENTFELALKFVKETKTTLRLEICSELGAEGFTPHDETVLLCLSEPLFEHTNLNIMIRPKLQASHDLGTCGMIDSFCYDDQALEIMKMQIRSMKKLLAQEKDKVKNREIGFVLGCIERTQSGTIAINTFALQEIIDVIQEPCELCHRFSVTFHKAFDLLSNPIESVQLLAALGVDRILTSLNFGCEDLKGKAMNSIQQFNNKNTEILKHFLQAVGNMQDASKVILLIGGDVRENNHLELVKFFEKYPQIRFELHSSTPFKIK